MKTWFIALIFATLTPCTALAADIYITPSIDTSGRFYSGPWYADLDENGCQIYINGIIEDGDFEKIKSIYDQGITYDPSGGEVHASGPNICLDSPGGSLVEAIKIAALIKNSSSTTILPNARCESACSIIFMAGSINGQASRLIYRSSKLGFHAQELILEESNYSSESVSKAYDLTITNTSKIVELQVLPLHVLEMFTSTPHSSMRYIETVDDLLKAEIGLLETFSTRGPEFFNGLPDLSVEQLVANICEHSYRMENNSFTEFAGYKDLSVTKSEIKGTALIRGDHEDFTFACNISISINNYGYCGSPICFDVGNVVSTYTSNPRFRNVLPFWNKQTKLSEMDRQVMSLSKFHSL